MFPGKKLLKNGKYNLTCKCGCVPMFASLKVKRNESYPHLRVCSPNQMNEIRRGLIFPAMAGVFLRFWENILLKNTLSLQGAKAPFFLLCISIARKNSRERASASLSGKISSCIAWAVARLLAICHILYGRLEAIRKKPNQLIPGYNKIEGDDEDG